jgi:hypothetical protein
MQPSENFRVPVSGVERTASARRGRVAAHLVARWNGPSFRVRAPKPRRQCPARRGLLLGAQRGAPSQKPRPTTHAQTHAELSRAGKRMVDIQPSESFFPLASLRVRLPTPAPVTSSDTVGTTRRGRLRAVLDQAAAKTGCRTWIVRMAGETPQVYHVAQGPVPWAGGVYVSRRARAGQAAGGATQPSSRRNAGCT